MTKQPDHGNPVHGAAYYNIFKMAYGASFYRLTSDCISILGVQKWAH